MDSRRRSILQRSATSEPHRPDVLPRHICTKVSRRLQVCAVTLENVAAIRRAASFSLSDSLRPASRLQAWRRHEQNRWNSSRHERGGSSPSRLSAGSHEFAWETVTSVPVQVALSGFATAAVELALVLVAARLVYAIVARASIAPPP